MEYHDALARQTLDTLPLNVAVLDAEGTILLTNRAWDEFAGMGGGESDMVGRNYLEPSTPTWTTTPQRLTTDCAR